jgi:hypothetical protein
VALLAKQDGGLTQVADIGGGTSVAAAINHTPEGKDAVALLARQDDGLKQVADIGGGTSVAAAIDHTPEGKDAVALLAKQDDGLKQVAAIGGETSVAAAINHTPEGKDAVALLAKQDGGLTQVADIGGGTSVAAAINHTQEGKAAVALLAKQEGGLERVAAIGGGKSVAAAINHTQEACSAAGAWIALKGLSWVLDMKGGSSIMTSLINTQRLQQGAEASVVLILDDPNWEAAIGDGIRTVKGGLTMVFVALSISLRIGPPNCHDFHDPAALAHCGAGSEAIIRSLKLLLVEKEKGVSITPEVILEASGRAVLTANLHHKLKVKTKREYTQAQSWANEGGGGSSSSSNDPVLEFAKALVLSAGALKPKVWQVDLAEALAINTGDLSRYLTGKGRAVGQDQPPAVVAAFAELMTEKGDSRETIITRAMQIRQRKLDTKAAAKQAKAPAEQKNKRKRESSPPASISGRAPRPKKRRRS